MRWYTVLLAAIFLLCGMFFGALNSGLVELDFFRWQFSLPLGVALLGFALLGAAAAGLLLGLTVVWPQHRKIRQLSREQEKHAPMPETAPEPAGSEDDHTAYPATP